MGAGAVVSKDVPPFAVVAGVPAKIIRMRFDDDTVQKLLRISWWNWTQAKLSEALDDFRNLSAEEFVQKYDPLRRGRLLVQSKDNKWSPSESPKTSRSSRHAELVEA